MKKICPITEGLQAEVVEREVLIADAEHALKKLTLALGEDAATRVFSAVVGKARRQAFCHIHGVEQIQCGSYRERHRKKGPAVIKIPPATDHGTRFGKDGVSSLFVSQPYALDHDQLLQIMDFCEANNLQVEIGASLSWWFAGKTLTVVYKDKEEAIAQERSYDKT
jgi:hypothetical protein